MSNEPGFPRPLGHYNGVRHPELTGTPMPTPWLAAKGPEEGVWANVCPERAQLAEVNKLCIVCGLSLDMDFIFLLLFGKLASETADYWGAAEGVASPSPTWAHVKCGILACTFCPHLKDLEYPACSPDMKTLYRLADLKALAVERRLAMS